MDALGDDASHELGGVAGMADRRTRRCQARARLRRVSGRRSRSLATARKGRLDLSTAQLGNGSLLGSLLGGDQTALSVWMQTTGASLLAVQRSSPVHVRTLADDSRSASGLLYPTAVRDGGCQPEHCQDHVDVGATYQLGRTFMYLGPRPLRRAGSEAVAQEEDHSQVPAVSGQ
jgi:hypothetical protein